MESLSVKILSQVVKGLQLVTVVVDCIGNNSHLSQLFICLLRIASRRIQGWGRSAVIVNIVKQVEEL